MKVSIAFCVLAWAHPLSAHPAERNLPPNQPAGPPNWRPPALPPKIPFDSERPPNAPADWRHYRPFDPKKDNPAAFWGVDDPVGGDEEWAEPPNEKDCPHLYTKKVTDVDRSNQDAYWPRHKAKPPNANIKCVHWGSQWPYTQGPIPPDLTIRMGIHYLFHNPWGCGARPGECMRVSCKMRAAVYLCFTGNMTTIEEKIIPNSVVGSSPEGWSIPCRWVAEKVAAIRDYCVEPASEMTNYNYFQGRYHNYTDGWHVFVGYDADMDDCERAHPLPFEKWEGEGSHVHGNGEID